MHQMKETVLSGCQTNFQRTPQGKTFVSQNLKKTDNQIKTNWTKANTEQSVESYTR